MTQGKKKQKQKKRQSFHELYLAREISKDGVVEPRLLFRQLRERDRIVQIKHKVRQGFRNASIRVVGHDGCLCSYSPLYWILLLLLVYDMMIRNHNLLVRKKYLSIFLLGVMVVLSPRVSLASLALIPK